MKKMRIFLIEENRILSDGLSKLINSQDDMILAGTASGRDNILSKVKKAKSQIVLVDAIVLGQSGVLVAKSLKTEGPELKVIGMGLPVSGADIADFVQAGASGYILEDAGASDVLETIRWVARKTNVVLPNVPDSLVDRNEARSPESGADAEERTSIQLTRREQEIVQLIADSSSNKEIARRLNIATFTVKSHVHNILLRLGFHSRLQIAKYVLVSHSGTDRGFAHEYKDLMPVRQQKYAGVLPG
jgi:DNA-binding NarL/FixJ family response regulator